MKTRLEEILLEVLLGLMACLLMALFVLSFFSAEMTIYPDRFNFGAVDGGPKTGKQVMVLEFKNKWTGARANYDWTIYLKENWLDIEPKRGKGRTFVNVSLPNIPLKQKSAKSELIIYVPRLSHLKKRVEVEIKIYKAGETKPPFGWMDLPLEEEMIRDQEILIAGWALDDIEVEEVLIKREPLTNEQNLDEDGLINLGPAALRAGIRPDVEKLFPNYPFHYRASWGFGWPPSKLLEMAKSGNLNLDHIEMMPIKLCAVVKDKEGNKTILGPRKIFLKLQK